MFCTKCGKEQNDQAKFCHHCGSSHTPETNSTQKSSSLTQNTDIHNSTSSVRIFYVVSVGKFLLLSTLTFGLYAIFWFANNWTLIKNQEKSNISPPARAFFGFIFFSELATKVLKSAKENGYDRSYSSTTLAIGYIGLSLLSRLPDNLWFLGLFNVLVFIPILEAILYNNKKLALPQKNFNNYSIGEIITIVVGVIFWLLVIIGSLS